MERMVNQQLKELGYSKSLEIDGVVAAFTFLLPKYDPCFVVGSWLAEGEKQATILRYMKNLGLGHHFNGKAQEVGAAKCKQANYQALADLIQKMEEKHGEDLYDKENCPSARNLSNKKQNTVRDSASSVQESLLHMPATPQRTSLGVKETDLLALEEAAKKRTGRHASSLGPAELAYIVELQQEKIKDELAEQQKQIEKQSKKSQYEEEFAIAQLDLHIVKLENAVLGLARKPERLSTIATNCNGSEKVDATAMTEELRALKKQKMGMLMKRSLAEEEAKKAIEELKLKERAVDHLAKQRQQNNEREVTAAAANVQKSRGKCEEMVPRAPTGETRSETQGTKLSRMTIVNIYNDKPAKEERRSRPTGAAEEDKETRQKGVKLKGKEQSSGPAVRSPRREKLSGASERKQVKNGASAEERGAADRPSKARGAAMKLACGREDRSDDDLTLKRCEKERKAMIKEKTNRAKHEVVVAAWGSQFGESGSCAGSSLPPQREHNFLERMSKERKRRVRQMRSEAEQATKERRRGRGEVGGGHGAQLIVVNDTPWMAKRKDAKGMRWAVTDCKPTMGRKLIFESESQSENRREEDTGSSEGGHASPNEEGNDESEASDGDDGEDSELEEKWDDRHSPVADSAHGGDDSSGNGDGHEELGSDGEQRGEAEPTISKLSKMVVINGELLVERAAKKPSLENRAKKVCESEGSEEDERDAEVLFGKAKREWRWKRDRLERERVKGKRRADTNEKPLGPSVDSIRSESGVGRVMEKVGGVDQPDDEEEEKRREERRRKMKVMMEDYLSDLLKPSDVLLLDDLSTNDEDDTPEENRRLQAIVEVLEARARKRPTIGGDEDLARMSVEERKRAVWGHNYREDNVKWAVAQRQQIEQDNKEAASARSLNRA